MKALSLFLVFAACAAFAQEPEPDPAFQKQFYEGLNNQKAADAAGDPEQARKFLDAAEAAYWKALELNPESGATLLNLSQLVGNHDPGMERQLLERGLAIQGPHHAQLAERLGDIEAEEWWSDADFSALYKAVAYYSEARSTRSGKQKYLDFVEMAGTQNEKRLHDAMNALWIAAEGEEADRVLQGSLHLLQQRVESLAAQDPELLTLVAAGLSLKAYDGESFAKSDVPAKLQEVLSDASRGDDARKRIRSLFRLYEGKITSPSQLAVWKTPADNDRDWPSGLACIQQIVRGLGIAAQQAGDWKEAEREYRLALRIDPEVLDGATLANLAMLYFTRHQLRAFMPELKRFEERIDEYAPGQGRLDWQEVYDYYRTVGALFLWDGQYANAERELTDAINLANAINSDPFGGVDSESIEVAAEVRLHRAEARARLGMSAKAAHDRLVAADSFIDDRTAMRDVLSAVRPQDVRDADDQKQMARLFDMSVLVDPALDGRLEIQHAIAVLSGHHAPPLRQAAEEALKKKSVTDLQISGGSGTFRLAGNPVHFELPE